MSEPIKVLVVDDSLIIRKQVTEVLSDEDDIEVVGVAMDGDFALMKLGRLLPDVIILDINMPRMDGLTALKIIGEEYDIPTIILSAFTREGAYTTLQALKYGAIDFICKPSEKSAAENKAYLKRTLVEKIKMACQIHKKGEKKTARAKKGAVSSYAPQRPVGEIEPVQADPFFPTFSKIQEEKLKQIAVNVPETLPRIVAIGASTGGTIAVEKIIKALPENFPLAILVVQHMPKEFTSVFAETLNQNTLLSVREAIDGELVMPGNVYVAPGDAHMQLRRRNVQYLIQLDRKSSPINGMRPSVDMLFYSLAAVGGKKAIGIILTGMGKDGAYGIKALKKAGAHIIAQDEESCVVFGMPKEAIKTGGVDQVLPLQDIPSWLMYQISKEKNGRKNFG